MPKYEVMYFLPAGISDTEEPTNAEVKKYITDFGGQITEEQVLGRRKFAYAIRQWKSGYYFVIGFIMEPTKLADLDLKLRVSDNVLRYIIVNMDEASRRKELEKVAMQEAKLRAAKRVAAAPAVAGENVVTGEIKEEDLEKKIDEALSPELQ